MATKKRKAAKRAAVKPIRVESGNKVGWETYRLKYHAQLAARRARARAKDRLAQGYDFGYQVPGTMERVDDGWRVCVP